MTLSPIPADLRLLAPSFAARFAALIAELIGFIALRLVRHPTLATLTPLLCRRLQRVARIITNTMARIAAGRRPRIDLRRNRARTPRPASAALPASAGWLLRELKHEAALTRLRLETLLAEPGIAELLAVVPTLQRVLNPLRRALAIGHAVRAVKPPALPPTPQPQPAKPQLRFVHFARTL